MRKPRPPSFAGSKFSGNPTPSSASSTVRIPPFCRQPISISTGKPAGWAYFTELVISSLISMPSVNTCSGGIMQASSACWEIFTRAVGDSAPVSEVQSSRI